MGLPVVFHFIFRENPVTVRSNAKGSTKTSDVARELRAELARLGAPEVAIDPAAVKAMKPETRETPFSRPGWVFELKYDGYRVLAAGGQGEARLSYKSGLDATRILPELSRAVAALPFASLILDGEAVVQPQRGGAPGTRCRRQCNERRDERGGDDDTAHQVSSPVRLTACPPN